MSGSFSLGIKDLHQLEGTLSDVDFDKTKWFDLGLALHLLETELKAIKDKCSRDCHSCLRECLCLWLKSAGSPQVLANALGGRSISEKAAAERIHKIFCNPSSQYLMSCSDELRDVVFDDSIVSLMYNERLIDERIQEEIAEKGNILFDGAIRVICLKLSEDPSKLKVLADILLKSETTKSVGGRLLSNFNQNLNETQELSHKKAESEKLFVKKGAHEEMFETMQGDFGRFKNEITSTIAEVKLPMKGQKEFLKCCFPELKSELSSAKTTKKIVNTLLEKCTIVNVAVIKTYVEKYKIKSGITLVKKYQKKVEEFCSKAKVELALNENLSPGTSSLQCEEIEIVLDWEPSEYLLKNITLLLEKIFSHLNTRVIIKTIAKGSVIITCYAPQYLMNELLLLAQAKLSVLREEEKLIRLRFGYHIVFDETTKEKEIKQLDEDLEKSRDSHKITGKIGPEKERESKHSHTEASRQLRQGKLIRESLKVMLSRKPVDEVIKRKKDSMIQKSKPFLRERKKNQKRTDINNGETTKTVSPILVPEKRRRTCKSNADPTKRWTSPIKYTSPTILVH